MAVSDTQRNFQSLSVKDLLEARDLYHYHLMNKANVVGTAIGLYLIRNSDPWPAKSHSDHSHDRSKPREERNLHNSGVRDYSWPCVLVLVKKWVDEDQFKIDGELHPDQMVPKTLYLPDGRMVPVCIVKAETGEDESETLLSKLQWPRTMIGGGYPLLLRSQREEHIASVGCLVSDGHTVYALTNRHVAGAEGERIYTLIRGREVEIGRASRKQLTRRRFSDVYPEYSGRRTYCNLDIGLIEIYDANQWTSEIAGIGPIGELADFSESNLSLGLINSEVMAFGSASGLLHGRISAFFYRYKSVGGYDYVSDFLIAPEAGEKPQTRAGDSGTVWLLKPGKGELPRPIAIEWGAQSFVEGSSRACTHFTLATSLSNVCKLLDVELMQAHNAGAQVTWGATGHYSIAAYAMSLLQSSKLQNFLQDNKDAISYDSGFDPKDIEDRLKQAKQNHDFVPLADVPDIIWKNLPSKVKGGRDTQPAPHGSTGPEHPNHYADVDQIWPAKSKTMLQLCSGSGSGNVNVQFWSGYYAALQKTKDRDQGLLPFRVWQFYKEMVKYVTAQDVERFLCAAGVLSHYVGDACQPLHGSMYSDGYSDQPQTIVRHHKATGEAYEDTTWPGQGVHSTYEDKMVDDHAPKLFQLVQGQLSSLAPFQLITGGQAAAQLTVDLMNFAQDHLAPKTIVDTYVQAGGKKNKKTSDALFKKCGTVTARLWLEGARTLACLWDSAWEEGNGKSLASAALKVIPTTRLQDIYENDDKFAPSKYLKDIPPYL